MKCGLAARQPGGLIMSMQKSPVHGEIKASSSALSEIYSQHFKPVFSFMSARFHDRETAKDLTHEVFTRLIRRSRSTLEIRESVSSYLYTIARNVVADFRAKGRFVRHDEGLETLESMADPSPQTVVERRMLEQCLQRLKAVDRRILVQYFWMGDNHAVIARQLDMTPAQVRQRFHRALGRLKKCLNP